MTFLDLLAFKRETIYSLSKRCGIAKSTLMDIGSGKTDVLDCSGKTLLAISKALNVSIEELLSLEREEAKSTLPPILYESIKGLRKELRKNSLQIDCGYDELNSSINVAEVENLISKKMAARLRERYFG